VRPLLYLSYLFPPRGGAGVQRSLKFAKYLPQFGWRPLVVASGTEADDRVTTVADPTLLKDLPADAVVRYTTLTAAEQRRFRRAQRPLAKRLAVTDPMGWWVWPAVRSGMELVAEHKPEAILVTMSPFTSAEAGIHLKHLTRLPLVLDLRDPWAMDETRIYPTRWHAWRDWSAMARAMRAADLVVMNTPQARQAAEESFRFREGTRVISITNGFDPEDFGRQPMMPAGQQTLRIVHTGMFHSEWAQTWDDLYAGRGWINKLKYPRRPINLWTRTARYLLEAMSRLLQSGAMKPHQLELVLVGEQSPADRAMVQASPAATCVRMVGYQRHEQSVAWLQSADVLFLPNHTPLDGGPALVVPGKTYEYLGSGRPILLMGPPGDARDFVLQAGAGVAVAADDAAGAAEFLQRAYDAKQCGQNVCAPDRSVIQRFERRELAQQLAQELNLLVESSSRQPMQV